MLTDHDGGIAVQVQVRSGEQLESRCSKRVLVGAAVECQTHQLLGGGIGNRADRHVGLRQCGGIVDPSCDAEIGQHRTPATGIQLGQQDVGRLDVAVQQLALMGVVERVGDRGDDLHDFVGRHALAILLLQQAGSVGALDVGHRYPQLALVLAAVVNGDDVRVRQRGSVLGFAIETFAIRRIVRHVLRQHLQRVAAWQPRVLNEIDLSHRTRTQPPQNFVSGEHLAGC